MTSIPSRPSPALVWTAMTVIYTVWGSTYLGIRIMVETIPPLLGGGFRFLTAALVMGTVLVLKARSFRVLRVSRRELGGAAIVGLLLPAGGQGLVTIGEQWLPSSIAALLIASVPLWLVVYRTLNHDRPRPTTFAGVAIGFTGLAVLSLTKGGGAEGATAIGVLLVLVAALSWSTGSFFSSRLTLPSNPLVATTYEMLAGALALLLMGGVTGERVDLATISPASGWAWAYLVTFGSLLAFTCYSWLLHNAPISLVGTYAYVNPVVAVALGALILGESVTWAMAIAGLVIVSGVGLVVSTERASRKAPAAEREPART